MDFERVYPLDSAALNVFAIKGTQSDIPVAHTGNSNAVKVRRVMQLLRDHSSLPFDQLRILDLGCGEGVYSIEAALRGATVLGVDARMERMKDGAAIADRFVLRNLRFEQADIRKIARSSHGQFDAVLMLGILYHLDQDDIFPILANIFALCGHVLIIDTHISLSDADQVQHLGEVYYGTRVREHAEADSLEVRKSRLLASLDNPLAFLFTKESLLRLLHNVGFTSISECYVPFEAAKPQNRITLVAIKGEPVKLSSYPWINSMSENEIVSFLKNK